MARYSDSQSSGGSTARGGASPESQIVKMLAGKKQIRKKDLLYVDDCRTPSVYPVARTSDFLVPNAGNQPWSEIAFSGIIKIGAVNHMISDDGEGAYYFASGVSESSGIMQGLKIIKVSYNGDLIGEIQISGAIGGIYDLSILKLSNGHFAVVWGDVISPSVRFCIFSKNLEQIKEATIILNTGSNPPSRPGAVALSGGGFMVAFAYASYESYVAIYSNTGSQVLAPSKIVGSTISGSGNTGGPSFALQVLQNGNVAVVDATSNGGATGLTIYTPLGGLVKGWSLVGTAAGWSANYNRYGDSEASDTSFAICMHTGFAAVYGNNGNVLHTAHNEGCVYVKKLSDKFVFFGSESGKTTLIFVNFSGQRLSKVVLSQGIGSLSNTFGKCFVYDNFLTYATETSAMVFDLDDISSPKIVSKVSAGIASAIISEGRFLAYAKASTTGVVRLFNSAVIGVALDDVSANSNNVLCSIDAGPCATEVNKLPGKMGVKFDNSASAITGNAGVIYHNAVVLKGLGK